LRRKTHSKAPENCPNIPSKCLQKPAKIPSKIDVKTYLEMPAKIAVRMPIKRL
jgi:hypothetical protein